MFCVYWVCGVGDQTELMPFNKLLRTRKKVPELKRPGFRLHESYRQKIGVIFCEHNCMGVRHGPESQIFGI